MPTARAHLAMLPAAVLCGALACAGAATAQVPVPTPIAQAGAATLVVAASPALRGRVTRVSGTLPDAAPGATVQIQRLDPARGWLGEGTAVAGAGGTFAAPWKPRASGRFTVRAVATGSAARAAAAAPTAAVAVYRPAVATWYGPGLYGHRTACGQRLSRRIMGVAHRKLPCGTPVEVSFGGRALTVPVIDRGPFSGHARFDLTSAAAQQLGVLTTVSLGFIATRGATMAPPLAPPPLGVGTGGTPSL